MGLRDLRQLAALPVRGGAISALRGAPIRSPPAVRSGISSDERDRAGAPPVRRLRRTAVLGFLADAAADPDVVAIRADAVPRRASARRWWSALLRAALRRGRRSSLFVELKASYDEARNIGWVRRLERAGATGRLRRRRAQEPREGGAGGAARGRDPALRPRGHRQLQRGDRAGLHRPRPALRRSAIGGDVGDLFNQLTGSVRAARCGSAGFWSRRSSCCPGCWRRSTREADAGTRGSDRRASGPSSTASTIPRWSRRCTRRRRPA